MSFLPPPKRRSIRRGALLALAATVGLLAASQAGAQQALPVEVLGARLTSVSPERVYTIDLGTLPTRPALVVEVIPDSSHGDMQLEIELSNFVNMPPNANGCTWTSAVITSAPSIGAASLDYAGFIDCNPTPGALVGAEVDVTVRALSFGSGGTLASVDIAMRGDTRVPTGTLMMPVETDLSPQTVFLNPSKDTVIYASDSATSNGLGAYLWAGQDYRLYGGPIIFGIARDRLNSLVSFDVVDTLPFNAVVTNADLSVYVYETLGGGGLVSVYETGASSTGGTWNEGNANPSSTEFTGVVSSSSAANWLNRRSSVDPWTTPGGDVGPFLASRTLTTTGAHTFSSTALTNSVQGMVDDRHDADGFLLIGPGGTFFSGDVGVRMGSGEYPQVGARPTLRVDYVPLEPYVPPDPFDPLAEKIKTGVVSFIGEGEDFRWIYDLDQDDILVTSIGGVCEVLAPEQVNYLPYTYSYAGAPGYTGLDCCTWQIDAPQTGTVGTGQAIFFHNLDPNDPNNMPPDTDGDGIRDLCDNCVNMPNGPALGSCVGPGGVAGTCTSQQNCGPGFTCQFAQEDSDGNFAGDACSVPEPGFGVGLLLGGTILAALRRRRD